MEKGVLAKVVEGRFWMLSVIVALHIFIIGWMWLENPLAMAISVSIFVGMFIILDFYFIIRLWTEL